MNHISVQFPQGRKQSFDKIKSLIADGVSYFSTKPGISFSEEVDDAAIKVIFCAEDEINDKMHREIQEESLISLSYINDSLAPVAHPISLADEGMFNSSILDAFFIGLQRQITDVEQYKEFRKRYFECKFLGEVSENLSIIEPNFRDSQIAVFNFNAVKSSDFHSKTRVNPSGFHSEHFIQLCRYAGLSSKIETVVFTGYDPEKLFASESDGIFISQAIWYLLEGILSRKNDSPKDEENRIYAFDIEEVDTVLQFINHHETDRWWMSWESEDGPVIVSANYTDYQLMKQGFTPDRFISAYFRHR